MLFQPLFKTNLKFLAMLLFSSWYVELKCVNFVRKLFLGTSKSRIEKSRLTANKPLPVPRERVFIGFNAKNLAMLLSSLRNGLSNTLIILIKLLIFTPQSVIKNDAFCEIR